MAFINRAILAIKRILIVTGIAIAFSVGLGGAFWLSLHSSETTVPNIVGKDRADAENAINEARLNLRVRATRATSEAKPDTVLIQRPPAGERVKVGQTVAVDISGPGKNGYLPPSPTPETDSNSSSESKTNSISNENENKPKRKPANVNANANANLNANRQANQNRNTNANRATSDNLNANRATTPVHSNVNANTGEPRNLNRNSGGTNTNRRPVAAPTP